MVFPLSFSLFKNFLSSKKSLVNSSSFKWASQLSCSVSISNFSSSFCSSVNFSSHFSLSNAGAATGGSSGLGLVKEDKGDVWVVAPAGLGTEAGCLKKDVMLALALGFFATSVASSPALRLSEVDIT